MTISQMLDQSRGDKKVWFNAITVTDIPKGYFLAVTGVSIAEGSTTRQIAVMIMPAEWADGGTKTTDSGAYFRKSGETAVCVTVIQNGVAQCKNTQMYPS